MKDQIVQLKVTSHEKNQIHSHAQKYGGTLSQYIKHQLLKPNDQPIGIDKQNFVRILCGHARLIGQIENMELRSQLEDIEVQLWRLIK